MQAELEVDHHTEIPAAAAQRPEQIRILSLAGMHETAIGRHHVGAHEIVAGQAVPAPEPADAA